MLPVLAINLAFAGALPPAYRPGSFWAGIPGWLALAENAGRVAVTALPLAMAIGRSTARQRLGLVLYGIGLLAYAAGWAMLVLAPESGWSTSLFGFSAPAWLPALWLIGIGLAGRPYRGWVRPLFWLAALVFLASHTAHAALVFSRLG